MGGVLSRVFSMLESDVATKPFDWTDNVSKELAVFINCCLEERAIKFAAEKNIVPIIESLLKVLKISEKGHFELISRCLNILAKVGKNDYAQD